MVFEFWTAGLGTPWDPMLTLFHHPFCPHSRFVRIAAGEYGLNPTLIEERPWERRDEFLVLNPAGTTPVLLEEGPSSGSGRRDHRGISRRDPRRHPQQPSAVAGRHQRAGRGAAPDKLVQRQVLCRSLRPPDHGARAQAADEPGPGRRPAGARRDPCGARQYPLSSRLYQLAGAHPPLACRRAHELCGPRRGRASFGDRLSGRCAVERGRGCQELVRAGEVAPVAATAADRVLSGDSSPRRTYADLDF